MKTFEYRGFETTGRACRGLVEADGPKDAREKLAARGILVERIRTATTARPSLRRWPTDFGLSSRAVVYRELSALVRAGLPLAGALDVLIEAPELGDDRTRLAGIRDRIREGASLAHSLAQASPRVTAFEHAAVEVGERAGTLDEVLERLAGFLEEQELLRDRVQAALFYPAIVLGLGIMVAILMLGLMIPRVGRLLAEANIPLPMITRLTIGAGRWTGLLLLPLVIAAAAGWGLYRWRAAGDPGLRLRTDRFLFRLPLWGRGYALLVNLRFARTLAMLLKGGVPLVDGVGLAGRATGSAWVERLAEEAADEVRHGKSLADAVRLVPPLGASLPGWIQAGEASGRLEDLLESAAARCQHQWETLISRRLAVLEPLLILIVGAFVLLVSLSILLPLLSLNRSLV